MISKGIIFAGGQGTRLRPMTLGLTKHLQVVFDQPMIYYPLATLLTLNIREITLIVHPEDLAPYQRLLGEGERFGVELRYVLQYEYQNFAKNIGLTESFIQNQSVCVIFADNFFHGEFESECPAVDAGAQVVTYTVPNPTAYGVLVTEGKGKPVAIEEKPQVPKSELAVTGLYFFDNELVLLAAENQNFTVTDINNYYLEKGQLSVSHFSGQWFDLGTVETLSQASEYVKLRQQGGELVGSPEWIAWTKQYITEQGLADSLDLFKYSAYGKKLLEIFQGQ